MQTHSLHKTITQLILIILFVGIVWAPLIGTQLGLDKDRGHGEKRKLDAMPDLPKTLEDLEKFPKEFEGYYDDHFGFRNTLIRMHSRYQKRLFEDSSSHRVLVGMNGWLFYKDDRVLDDYRATDPFTLEELLEWQKVLEARRDWLKDRGIEYIFIIVPNKHTIYSEFLPDYIRRMGRKSRFDQLKEHMDAYSDLSIVDPRPAFFEAKKKERIYHRLDTHWNDRGAYMGYRLLMERVSGLFPELKPFERQEFISCTEKAGDMDLVLFMGLKDALIEECLNLDFREEQPITEVRTGLQPSFCSEKVEMCWPFAMEQDAHDLPRAVIFRDSAFMALVKFFAPHFRRSAYYWQYEFDCAVVEHEKPDVVIQEFSERAFMKILPENPEELKSK